MPQPTIDPRWAELFSVMVHDVRTPMTVVAGYVDMLLKERFGPLTDKQRHVLEEVQKSCGRVSALLKEGSDLTSIERKMMPIVLRHAISGVAHINTEDTVLDDPRALAMLIDVFSERGYHAAVDIHRVDVPERVDLATGAITCSTKKVYRVRIRFQGSEIRRG